MIKAGQLRACGAFDFDVGALPQTPDYCYKDEGVGHVF